MGDGSTHLAEGTYFPRLEPTSKEARRMAREAMRHYRTRFAIVASSLRYLRQNGVTMSYELEGKVRECRDAREQHRVWLQIWLNQKEL